MPKKNVEISPPATDTIRKGRRKPVHAGLDATLIAPATDAHSVTVCTIEASKADRATPDSAGMMTRYRLIHFVPDPVLEERLLLLIEIRFPSGFRRFLPRYFLPLRGRLREQANTLRRRRCTDHPLLHVSEWRDIQSVGVAPETWLRRKIDVSEVGKPCR